MITQAYKAQVDLLLQVLPYIAKEEMFALKGGTAINLFVRDMPRLSVDVDLWLFRFDLCHTFRSHCASDSGSNCATFINFIL